MTYDVAAIRTLFPSLADGPDGAAPGARGGAWRPQPLDVIKELVETGGAREEAR